MGPHADDFNDSLLLQNFIDQSVLNSDAAGISAGQVAHQFFKPRRSLKWIFSNDLQQLNRFVFETGRAQLPGIFLSLLGIDDFPCHQSSSLAHPSTGVCKPSRMDSRIPGMDRRYKVS